MIPGDSLTTVDGSEIVAQWGTWPAREKLRKLYSDIHEYVMLDRWSDPYWLDWSAVFTPIEMDAWCSIRAHALPFYPQYPVGRYFVDFANPYHKIALELDGAAYHDEAKDAARDKDLTRLGWVVFRVTGKEAVRGPPAFEDILDEHEAKLAREDWLLHTCDGVVHALNVVYGRRKEKHDDLIWRTLNAHVSAGDV